MEHWSSLVALGILFCRISAASGASESSSADVYSGGRIGYPRATVRRLSPTGSVEAAFEAAPVVVMPDPDKVVELPPERQLRRYQVTFYKPGTNTAVAVAPFADLSGSPHAPKPLTVDQLYQQLYWSPEDDFVVLPQERAASGVFAGPRRVVSLNKAFPWQILPFPLDLAPLVWVDARRPVGNVRADCRWEVSQFDGPTGKVNLIHSGSQIEGYRIVEVRERQVVMQKYLSSCATPEEARAFHEDCVAYDLSFLRRELTPCP